mmetsp:Transcript_13965/g.43766  ORF Transcript_13965/g.43766 Transcript_13965/m.43766 type:complete len:138 (-) Transcript_13965:560-973(-)
MRRELPQLSACTPPMRCGMPVRLQAPLTRRSSPWAQQAGALSGQLPYQKWRPQHGEIIAFVQLYVCVLYDVFVSAVAVASTLRSARLRLSKIKVTGPSATRPRLIALITRSYDSESPPKIEMMRLGRSPKPCAYMFL